jgi:hypothetical protein
MGAWDVPLIIGAAAIGGYFILTNPDLITNLIPSGIGNTPTGNLDSGDDPPPGGDGISDPGPGGDGASECKTLCANVDCKNYNKKCSAGCSKCKGGTSGTGGDSSSTDCKKACQNCWCKTYNEKCNGSCSNCCGGSRIASKCGGQGVKSCSGGSSGGGGGSSGGGGDGFKSTFNTRIFNNRFQFPDMDMNFSNAYRAHDDDELNFSNVFT